MRLHLSVDRRRSKRLAASLKTGAKRGIVSLCDQSFKEVFDDSLVVVGAAVLKPVPSYTTVSNPLEHAVWVCRHWGDVKVKVHGLLERAKCHVSSWPNLDR